MPDYTTLADSREVPKAGQAEPGRRPQPRGPSAPALDTVTVAGCPLVKRKVPRAMKRPSIGGGCRWLTLALVSPSAWRTVTRALVALLPEAE